MGATERPRSDGSQPLPRRFAFAQPKALLVAMFVGLSLGLLLVTALINGWLGFELFDPFGQGAAPPFPIWVFNAVSALAAATSFAGAAALVPYEVRVDKDGLLLVPLIGERRLTSEEIRGVTRAAPRFCLIHTRRLVFLCLPQLGDLTELQELLLDLTARNRRSQEQR